MSIFWKPSGALDISTDPSSLPENSDGTNITSDALTRCKNLRVDRSGVLYLRDGSSKFNSSAIASINLLQEQGGVRYAFGTSIYEDETSIASGLSSSDWSAIKYNAYNDTTQQVFALNGTDRKRVSGSDVNEWGISAPTSAPTTTGGASTGLTGDYSVKITYCRKVGSVVVCESNPSDASNTTALSNDSLSISWTASLDPQVTHVRVYRTVADGLTYLLDQDIAIGVTTLDTSTADDDLNTAAPSTHDRPPEGTFVFGPAYDGTCFIIKDNNLYFCLPKQPEYWPADYYIETSTPQFPGICGVFHNGQPYVLTKNKIYYIQGTSATTFFPLPMNSKTGAQGRFGAISIEGHGIYHTGPDGIYLFSGNADKKITEDRFEPIFRGETVNGMPGVSDMSTAWLFQYGNYLYFGYASETYPSNVIVFNLNTGKTAYYSYPFSIVCVEADETNNRIIAGDSDGYVRQIENQSQTTDSGTAIGWDVQSKEFTLQTRANFPRWVKYDVNSSSSASATGEVLLDGTVKQSHTLSDNRSVKRRLVETCNGERQQHRIYGSGPVYIYAVESE